MLAVEGEPLQALIYNKSDRLTGGEKELANLVKCLYETSSKIGMKISSENIELRTNNDRLITTKVLSFQLSVHMRISAERDSSSGYEMLQKSHWHLLLGQYHE